MKWNGQRVVVGMGALVGAAVVGAGVSAAAGAWRQMDGLEPPAPGSTGIACFADEPGERLLVAGTVVDRGGRAVAGATVHAYNTDAEGLYAPAGSPNDAHRIGVTLTTDERGRFQFLTVWPASYPGTNNPQHIHMGVEAPGRAHV